MVRAIYRNVTGGISGRGALFMSISGYIYGNVKYTYLEKL